MNKTLDSMFGGDIKVVQDATGYRFSIDSIILAYHVRPKPADVILDLGTGCGIIPLILGYREWDARIIGVEIQSDLAEMAAGNARLNNMEDRITIHHRDLRDLKPILSPESVDLVCTNPPYRKAGSGRVNPDIQRAIARHELKANLHDILQTSLFVLKKKGQIVVIYPADRLTDLLCGMREHGLEPKLLRPVHSYADSEAKLIIVMGKKAGRPGMKIDHPLTVYNKDGSYTGEMEAMLE